MGQCMVGKRSNMKENLDEFPITSENLDEFPIWMNLDELPIMHNAFFFLQSPILFLIPSALSNKGNSPLACPLTQQRMIDLRIRGVPSIFSSKSSTILYLDLTNTS